MKVGFTGTRNGWTQSQADSFVEIIRSLDISEFHHGACRGADADSVKKLRSFIAHALKIVAHPGVSAYGGNNADRDDESVLMSDEVMPEKTHFSRNRDIVNACDLIIACPPCRPMPDRGGTAYTLAYACGELVRTIVIWPDGECEEGL